MTETDALNEGIRKIAVICFLPDVGHVLPLLRLVHLETQHRVAHVTCFLAPRFEKPALAYGFAFHGLSSLEKISSGEVFSELSRRSNFYNAFSGFAVLADRYWAPISRAVGCELAEVAAKLNEDVPELVFADDHVFSDHYKTIADSFGARLVLHRSNGSLLPYRRPFVYAYGINDWPSWAQGLVELAGQMNTRLVRYWRQLKSPSLVRGAREAQASLQGRVESLFGKASPIAPRVPARVSCGTCVLEFERTAFNPDNTMGEIFLPPLIASTNEPLPAELLSWLSRQSRAILYISFGTLLRAEASVLRSLLWALKNAGLAAVWSIPEEQRASLAAEGVPPEQFFLADFVPQIALLLSGRISCFITHAGANSIHEALAAGVPMLCIPIIYDQHYNASVAVRLGSALKLSRRKVSSDRVQASVESLINNPEYARRARDLAVEISELQNTLARSWIGKIDCPAPPS